MNTDDLIKQIVNEGAKPPFMHTCRISLIWFGAIILYGLSVILLYDIRDDILIQIATGKYVLELGSFALASICAAIATFMLGLPDVGQKPWIRFLPIIAILSSFGMLLFLASNSTLTFLECIKNGRYDCMIEMILFSIIPMIIMIWVIYKAAPLKYYWAGAMAALSAACTSYIILRLIEKHDDPLQLLLWHFTPIYLVILLGVLCAHKYLRN